MKIKITLNELKKIVKEIIEEQDIGIMKFKANHLKKVGSRKPYSERDNTVFEITPKTIRMSGDYGVNTYNVDRVEGNNYFFKNYKLQVGNNKITVTMPSGVVLEYSVLKNQ